MGGRRLAITLSVLSLASLLGWLVLNQRTPAFAYLFFPIRFWELATGSLAYLAWRSRGRGGGQPPARPTLALTGALLALLAWPSGDATLSTLAVVLVTGLLLWGLQPGQTITRLLSSAPMRQVGLHSYALYLWHWSVLSLISWTVGIHAWTVPVQLTLIVALAVWSHRSIEDPLRHAVWGGSPPLTLLQGLLAVTVAGGLVYGLGSRWQARLYRRSERGEDRPLGGAARHSRHQRHRTPLPHRPGRPTRRFHALSAPLHHPEACERSP